LADVINNRKFTVQSAFKDRNGSHSSISINVRPDNTAEAYAFFDIDGTLAHLKFIHGPAIVELFRRHQYGVNEDAQELQAVYFDGFKLGNSFREFDRLIQIYVNGSSEYKDPEKYRAGRLEKLQKQIDSPGFPDHQAAEQLWEEYGALAAEITRQQYMLDPEQFAATRIDSIMDLAQLYGSLGIPMGGMTANHPALVEALAECLELSQLFIDIATDKTMEGGGKEIAIPKLAQIFHEKGVPPASTIILVGDSIRGDIGIGLQIKNLAANIKGVLVVETPDKLKQIKQTIRQDPALQNIIENVSTHAWVTATGNKHTLEPLTL
jgi:phosphoglycolate phosphatase-like HAD superfamily hydrolase